MQEGPETLVHDHPLRHLTAAQFAALGGNAVVYVRPMRASRLAEFIDEMAGDESDQELQLVVSADGSPLLVADSEEAVAEWLSDKNLGVVSLH
jgi:hypothetical protein